MPSLLETIQDARRRRAAAEAHEPGWFDAFQYATPTAGIGVGMDALSRAVSTIPAGLAASLRGQPALNAMAESAFGPEQASYESVLDALGMAPGAGRSALGLTGDMVLDPTNLATLGVGGAALAGTPKAAGWVARKAGGLGRAIAGRLGKKVAIEAPQAVAPTVGRTTKIARGLWKAKYPIIGAGGAGLAYNAGMFGGKGLPEEETPKPPPQAQVTRSGGGGGVRAPRPSPQADYSGLDQLLAQAGQSSPLSRAIAPTVAPPIAPPIPGKSGGVDWMELLKVFGPMLAAVLLSRR